MAFSIQTNVTSLVAQENLRVNQAFQQTTINRMTSGYRINASGDDAAGLAIANKYRSDITELTQGVRNANDGISTLQVIDGGLSNISATLDRLRTLATQSASTTFSGNRTTLNNEYQSLLSEITRQATNIGLAQGGANNNTMNVYIGGGNIQANSKVTVDLSGAANQVDAGGLGLNTSSIAGGGVTAGNVNLNASGNIVTSNESFTFNVYDSALKTTGTVVATVTAGAGITGSAALTQLNNQLSAYGISATTDASGNLAFGGTRAFSMTTNAAANTLNTAAAQNVVNTGVYNYTTAAGAFTSQQGAQTLTFQNASGTAFVTLADATTKANALASINAQTASLGIYAVDDPAANTLSIQSGSDFSLSASVTTTSSVLGGGNSTATIVDPLATASVTGNALGAISLLTTAVQNLGLVQGKVGTGQNLLGYAINLANSQISNFSAAQSRIRDTDMAAEAANLTKASVLQQASIAAMAQANSAPQAILALLRG